MNLTMISRRSASEHEERRRKFCGARCSCVGKNPRYFFNCAVRNETNITLQESEL
jgi:hypothetical protein